MFRPVVILLILSFNVGATEYVRVLPERSQIVFTSKQMGVPVEGRFSRYAAAIFFDPAKPETGRAQIELDLAGIDAGSKEADEEVKGKSWFNLREFPTAKFVSESVRSAGSNRYEAKGKISITGKTRDIVLPFESKAEGANLVLEGTIPILRSQFGIGEGPWADTSVVADEVPVKFRFVVGPKAASK